MAGLPIVPLLLAGGALLLLKKKEGEKDGSLPDDQGQSNEVQESSFDAEEVVFDVTADMPRIESIEDYEKWEGIAGTKDITWIGSIEFLSADEGLEELGQFIEVELDRFGSVYGRTIDRSDLDPVALDAMKQGNAFVENAIATIFADNPGLDMMAMFIKPEGARKMAVFLLFDTAANEQEAVTRIALFKDALSSADIEGYVQSGYRGMTNPSVPEAVKAFLHATLPKKTEVDPGLIPFTPNSSS